MTEHSIRRYAPTTYLPTTLADFYKISHREQYPPGTEHVYSNWTPRGSRLDDITEVVVFGLQSFIAEWLVDYFDQHFFSRPKERVVAEYVDFIAWTLHGGDESKVASDHIADLHDLGYLPLEIKALPEGSKVPLRCPMATVENTDPRFFWLTNYVETLWSAENWHKATTATIANRYREILDHWALLTTGSTDGVDFQAHDFSIRGMTSLDSAAKGGAGHLLSFLGTDNIPAIQYLERYYDGRIHAETVGTSIPATEHSVMSSYGNESEAETYRRLVTEVYPSGPVSIVSDTWDLWKVLTEIVPSLKDEIMAREGGPVVIRPDSGDPVDIMCGYRGTNRSGKTSAEDKGVVELLWETFGGTTTEQGYKVLDPHVRAIYGDSITTERAREMCRRLADKGFASTNIVLGVGSFTYQYVTRDTFNFAIKTTQVTVDGEERAVYKDPVTDKGHMKKSLRGRIAVVPDGDSVRAIDGLSRETQKEVEDDLLRTIFLDGETPNTLMLEEVRANLKACTHPRP